METSSATAHVFVGSRSLETCPGAAVARAWACSVAGRGGAGRTRRGLAREVCKDAQGFKKKVFWGQNRTSERQGKAEFLLLMAPRQGGWAARFWGARRRWDLLTGGNPSSCPRSGLRTPDHAWCQLAADHEARNYVSGVNFLGLTLCSPRIPQEQYEFCYKVVQEYIDAFSDYANFK